MVSCHSKMFLGVLLIALAGCTGEDDQSPQNLSGTWKVTSYHDHVSNTIEFPTWENSWELDITVTFKDLQTPHSISGINTTNVISAEFAYTGAQSFRAENLISTMVGQPAWADQFIDALLDDHPTFVRNGDQLRINYDDNRKSVNLVKQ